jgi:hypothetical protein
MPCRDGGPSREQLEDDRIAEAKRQKEIDIMCRLACAHCRLLEGAKDPIPEWAEKWWKEHKEWDKKREVFEKEHTYVIEINGVKKAWIGDSISYAEVIDLGRAKFNAYYSMIYRKARLPKTEGILHDGQSVLIKDGTRFEFVMTNNA